MSTSENEVKLKRKDLKGSRLRCLMLTSLSRKQIARCLTDLIQPYGVVDGETDRWMPQGFLDSGEAKLGETELFLKAKDRDTVTDWWLDVRPGANTPNWDLVATYRIEGRNGLVLIEGKAHKNELASAGKTDPGTDNGWKNHAQIGMAIDEANASLNAQHSGWTLSRDSHYQLCNRFAWSWKLASMGIPVILVYLGFLYADEMPHPFSTVGAWSEAVHAHSNMVVPDDIWESRISIDNTPLYPIIRSLDLQWAVSGGSAGGGT